MKGKIILELMEGKEITCDAVSDDCFEKIKQQVNDGENFEMPLADDVGNISIPNYAIAGISWVLTDQEVANGSTN